MLRGEVLLPTFEVPWIPQSNDRRDYISGRMEKGIKVNPFRTPSERRGLPLPQSSPYSSLVQFSSFVLLLVPSPDSNQIYRAKSQAKANLASFSPNFHKARERGSCPSKTECKGRQALAKAGTLPEDNLGCSFSLPRRHQHSQVLNNHIEDSIQKIHIEDYELLA